MAYKYKKISFENSDSAVEVMTTEGQEGWRVIHVHPNCIYAILEKFVLCEDDVPDDSEPA